MANQAPQSYANHVRWDPLFHFFLTPVFIINVIGWGYALYRRPNIHMAWLFLFSIALLVLLVKTRLYALKVQTRVIRLEERMRLSSLLQEPLRSRIGELTQSQLVALRFASEAELPTLVGETLNRNLSNAEIKKLIKSWNADEFRV
jgi:hypothetical protein